jgi:hypothetical protein
MQAYHYVNGDYLWLLAEWHEVKLQSSAYQ